MGVANKFARAVTDSGPSNPGSYGINNAPVVLNTANIQGSSNAAPVTAAPPAGQTLVLTDVVLSTPAGLLTCTLVEESTGKILDVLDITPNMPIQITPRGVKRLSTAGKRVMAFVQSGAPSGVLNVGLYYRFEA